MVIKALCLGANLLCSNMRIDDAAASAPLAATMQKTTAAATDLWTSQESFANTDVCPFEPFADVPPPQCFPIRDVEPAAVFGEKFLLSKQDQLVSANKQHTRVQNCLTSACPAVEENPGLIENAAIDVVVFKEFYGGGSVVTHSTDELRNEVRDELLRLNINDPREKLLYFRAARDGNGALNPKSSPQILNPLYNKFDMKYRVVQSYDEICEEIQEAAKIGKLTTVIIDAHGSPEGIYLSENKGIHRFALYSSPSCFAGLDPSATIFLFACCTGAPKTAPDTACFLQWDFPPDNGVSSRLPIVQSNYQPFAQTLADHSKRRIVAAEIPVNGPRTSVMSLDPFMVFHPEIRSSNTNTYKVFSPNPEQDSESFTSALTEALKTSISEIEHEVLDVVQKSLDRGEGIEAAVSAAREALKSSDFQIYTPAAFELLKILVRKGYGIETAINVVIEAFEKSTDFKTLNSAQALLSALIGEGHGFEAAIDVAIKASNSKEEQTKKRAFQLLEKLVDKGFGFKVAIDIATKTIDDNCSGFEIRMALELFQKIVEKGESFEVAISAAEKGLKSRDPDTRARALNLLSQLVDQDYGFEVAISPALNAYKNQVREGRNLLIKLLDKKQGVEATIGAANEALNSADPHNHALALSLFDLLVDKREGLAAARSAATEIIQKSAIAELREFAQKLLEKAEKQSTQETSVKQDL